MKLEIGGGHSKFGSWKLLGNSGIDSGDQLHQENVNDTKACIQCYTVTLLSNGTSLELALYELELDADGEEDPEFDDTIQDIQVLLKKYTRSLCNPSQVFIFYSF